MVASFCFALFSFRLDKVDETIIFVIIPGRRNVIVEDFCRCRALAQIKGMEKHDWEFWGSSLSFPFFSRADGGRIPPSLANPLSPWQKVISGALWSSREKRPGRCQYLSFSSFFPLHTHLYWMALYPQNNPCQAPKCSQRRSGRCAPDRGGSSDSV